MGLIEEVGEGPLGLDTAAARVAALRRACRTTCTTLWPGVAMSAPVETAAIPATRGWPSAAATRAPEALSVDPS